MKKHNLFKVIAIFCLVLMLLTWILPTARFQYSFAMDKRNMMGLFDLVNYPLQTLSFFSYIFIFALAVGAFYGVLSKTKVYKSLVKKITEGFKNKEYIFLSIVISLFAVITSTSGLSVGLMFLFPFIIKVILEMGYDKLTAATTTVGAVCVGLIGTTIAGASVGAINDMLTTKVLGEFWSKAIILIITTIILIYNVLEHAKKVKKEKVIELKEETEEIVVKKKSIYPAVFIMDAILILMILACISWVDVFGIKIFAAFLLNLNEFEVFGFNIFRGLLGTVKEFGHWPLANLTSLIVIGTVILALCYRVKFDDVIDGVKKGAKKAIIPAILMSLVYTSLIIVTYHPFQLVIYNFILGLTDGFNLLTTTVVSFIASLFNVEALYAGQSVLPYLASIMSKTKMLPLIAIIFQSMYGLVMLVAPTSVILIGTLSYLDISYFEWLKHIWKLFLELLLILVIIFIILLLI
ncbi:MAG: hypothetical protein RR359_01400 [Bacilli bacterium]